MKVSELMKRLDELLYPDAPVVLVLGTHGLRRGISRIEVPHKGGTTIQIVADKPHADQEFDQPHRGHTETNA